MDRLAGQAEAVLSMEQRLTFLQDAVREIGRLCARLEQLDWPMPLPGRQLAGTPQKGDTGQDQAQHDAAEISLRQFLVEGVNELTREERGQLVDAALAMIDQIYVHLPLKRVMYAVGPCDASSSSGSSSARRARAASTRR